MSNHEIGCMTGDVLRCVSETASMCTQTPYMGMSEEQIIQRKVHDPVDMEAPPCAPAAVAQLMQKCLDRQPCQRPTFAAIKNSLHALLATFWLDE